MNRHFKKLVSLTLVSSLLSWVMFLSVEGTVVNASTSTSTTSATVTTTVSLTVTDEISITCSDSVNLGSINGLSGGSAFESATCNVKASDVDGYTLAIHSATIPALRVNSSVYFSNYRTTTPEYTWTQNSTASSSFGYSVSSTDASTPFKNNGSTCGTGTTSTYMACFVGFNGGSSYNIATKSSATTVNGVTTTVAFKAEAGTTAVQPSGSYSASVVFTATNN